MKIVIRIIVVLPFVIQIIAGILLHDLITLSMGILACLGAVLLIWQQIRSERQMRFQSSRTPEGRMYSNLYRDRRKK